MDFMDTMDDMDTPSQQGSCSPFCVVTAVLALVVMGCLSLLRIWQPDVMMHVTAGRWIVEHGQLMRTDLFSHTAYGMPWPDFSWGAQVIMYYVVAAGGFELLSVFRTLCIVVGLTFVWRTARLLGSNGWFATAAMVASWFCLSQGDEARPYMFSLLLLPITVYLVMGWIRSDSPTPRRFAWVLVPLFMIFWANLHAAFPALLLSMAALWAGLAGEHVIRRAKGVPATGSLSIAFLVRFALFITVCLLVTLVNPFGWEVWFMPFRLGAHKIFHQHIAEWSAPTSIYFLPLLGVVIGGVLAALANWRRVRLHHLFLVLLWILMSLHARRQIAMAGMAIFPVFALWFQQLWDSRSGRRLEANREQRTRRTWAVPIAAILVFGVMPAGFYTITHIARARASMGSWGLGLDMTKRPVETMAFLIRERPVGEIFNDSAFGGDLIHTIYPLYRVAMDGRMEVYGVDKYSDYWEIVAAREGWEQRLTDMGVETVVISKHGKLVSKFWPAIKSTNRWSLVYEDNVAGVFVRSAGPNAALAERLAIAVPE